jgi:uncharacterized integral membrane protein
MWLLNAAIFFALFAFALNNQDDVTLRLFFGASWQAPLVLILLVALIAGVFLGVAVMLPLWLRARKARRALPPAAPATEIDASQLSQFPEPHDPRNGL